MTVVMVVAEIDGICGREVDGVAVSEAKTVGDLLLIAGLGEQQAIGAGDVGDARSVLG